MRRAESGCGGCRAISAAIRKYGANAFVLVEHKMPRATQDELDAAEREMIKKHCSMHPQGYNLSSGGRDGRHSESSLIRLGTSLAGRKLTAEHRKKLSEAQRSRRKDSPAEIKGRIIAAEKLKGRKRPEHVIQALRDRKGKKMTSDKAKSAAAAHSARMTGRSISPEQRSKQSASLKAFYAVNARSKGHCKRLSESQKGRVFSAETREKLRAARIRRLGREHA